MRKFCLLNNANYQKTKATGMTFQKTLLLCTLYSEKQEMKAFTKHKVGVGLRGYSFASFLQNLKPEVG